MECLKGTIQKMAKGFMLVKVSLSGHHFWFKATPTSRICRTVLIAWDYIHDEPRDVFTKEDLGMRLGGHELGVEFFSVPSNKAGIEHGDFDVPEHILVPPTEFWWREEGVECGSGLPEFFSLPFDDGCESMG